MEGIDQRERIGVGCRDPRGALPWEEGLTRDHRFIYLSDEAFHDVKELYKSRGRGAVAAGRQVRIGGAGAGRGAEGSGPPTGLGTLGAWGCTPSGGIFLV